ncbi:MAG: HutD family protein [Wujia sp.]
MKIRSVSKEEFQTTEWSGGTTTEFFIYPPGSDYKNRNFRARISSAYVADEWSKFTSLTGVTRYLAPLSQEITLKIQGEDVTLSPYEVIKFSGEDMVESYGVCRDFNLMLKDCGGTMECVCATARGVRVQVAERTIVALYCYEGKARLATEDGKEVDFDADQLILLENDSAMKEETVKLLADHQHIIICHIHK